MMKCVVCGKDFEPTNSGQVLCSKDRRRAKAVPRAARVAAAKEAAKHRRAT